MLRIITLTLFLFAIWLLLSGHFDNWFLIGVGIAASILAVFLAYRMSIIDAEGYPIEAGFAVFTYFPWLFYQIVLANIDVAKRIINPKLPICPTRCQVSSSQTSDLGKVIFANSITLTPGTVTLGIEKDTMDIHALSQEAADDLKQGEMDRRVTKACGD